MLGSSEIDADCYRGGQNGGGDPICGGAERWPPSCGCDESRSMLPEVFDFAVAKAAGPAPVELDQSVDRFGAAVASSVGVEVAVERLPPLL